MEIFIIILGAAVAVAGLIAGIYFSVDHVCGKTKEEQKAQKKIGLSVMCAGTLVFLLGCSITVVPTGYTGVRITIGQVSDQVVAQGLNFKVPFVQGITLVNNKQQDVTFENQIWGEASDQTPVYASNVVVTYRVSEDRAAWICANIAQIDSGLIDESIVSSALKSAMKELPASEVTSRGKIEDLTKEKLTLSVNEKYGEGTVEILKVIVNNMDFEDSYNQAIAQKSQAQQAYETQQIENETTVAKAQAEAEARRIEAQAEADANQLIANSVTENVLQSKFYDNWDGKLPSVMGDSAVITDINKTE